MKQVARGSRRDYISTFVTEFLVLGGSILTLKLAAVYWGTAGFGEYVLGRRVIGFLQPAVLCGMGLAVTRQVAMARAEPGDGEWSWLDGALLITLSTIAVTCMALLAFSHQVAGAFFGDASLAPLARGLTTCVAGLVLHYVAYAVLRGRHASNPANLLQAVNLGILPLIAFGLPGLQPAMLLFWLGLAQLAVSTGALVALRRPGPALTSPGVTWERTGRELFKYGAPRVPGEFMLGALSTFPVTAAAHDGGPVLAGQIGLGLSLLTLVGSVFTPLGILMLPSISARVAAGEVKGLGAEIRRLTLICLGLTVLGTIALELLAGWAIPFVFGDEFAGAVQPIRIIGLAAIPYVAYVILRNVLDAIHAAPLNAANLAVALAVQAAVIFFASGPASVPVAVAAGMTMLGLLTAWRTRQVVRAVVASQVVH